MPFHAQCERCGKYEQAPETGRYPGASSLPATWKRLLMHEDYQYERGLVTECFALCSGCAGDVWGGIAGQMKNRAKVGA